MALPLSPNNLLATVLSFDSAAKTFVLHLSWEHAENNTEGFLYEVRDALTGQLIHQETLPVSGENTHVHVASGLSFVPNQEFYARMIAFNSLSGGGGSPAAVTESWVVESASVTLGRATLALEETVLSRDEAWPDILNDQSKEFKSGIGDGADLLLRVGEGSAQSPWTLQIHSGHVYFGEHPFYFFANRRQEIVKVESRTGRLSGTPRTGSPLNVYPLHAPPHAVTATLEAILFDRDTGLTSSVSIPVTGSVPPLGLFFRLSDRTTDEIIAEYVAEYVAEPREDYIIRSVKVSGSTQQIEFAIAPDGKSPIWARVWSPYPSPRSLRRTYFLDNEGRLVLYGRHLGGGKKLFLPDSDIDQLFVNQGQVLSVEANMVTMDEDYQDLEILYTLKDSYLYDEGELFFAQDHEWVLVEYESAEAGAWGDTLINLNPIQSKIRSGFIYMAPRDRVLEDSLNAGGSGSQAKPILVLSSEEKAIALDGGRLRILCEAMDQYGSPIPFLPVEISSPDPGARFVDPDEINSTPVASLVKSTDQYGQFTVELVAPAQANTRSGSLYGSGLYDEALYQSVDAYESSVGTLLIEAKSADPSLEISDELELITYGDGTNRPKLIIEYGKKNKTQFMARLPLYQWDLPASRLTNLAWLDWDGGRIAVASRSSNHLWLIPSASGAYKGLGEPQVIRPQLSASSSISVSPSGFLWVGGKEGFSCFIAGAETHHPVAAEISAVAAFEDEKILAGSEDGKVFLYDAQKKKLFLVAQLKGEISALVYRDHEVFAGTSNPASVYRLDLSDWTLSRAVPLSRLEAPACEQIRQLLLANGELVAESESGSYQLEGSVFYPFASAESVAFSGNYLTKDPFETMGARGKIWHSIRLGQDYWFVRDHAVGVYQEEPHENLHHWIKVSVTLLDADDKPLREKSILIANQDAFILPAEEIFTGVPYVSHMRGSLVKDVEVTDPKETIEGRWFVWADHQGNISLFDAENQPIVEIPGIQLIPEAHPTPHALAVVHTFSEGQVVFYLASNERGKRELLVSSDKVGVVAPVIFEVL